MVGRPVKHIAPYFSHDANASGGRTLTILENHFGSDGYKAWFKLLENLSDTENHIIDIRNPADLEFLAGKMKFKPDRLLEILNKMADPSLKAIDSELWAHGIIWCQNFVDRLTWLYEKRKQAPPSRPEIENLTPIYPQANLITKRITEPETPIPATETPIPDTKTPIPVSGIHQSKVKKSKDNLSKSKKTTPLPPFPAPENLSSSSAESEKDDRNIYQIFEQEIGELTPGLSQILSDAEEQYTAPWVKEAIKIAVLNNKRSWSYIAAVLRKCKEEGHPPSESKKGNAVAKDYTGGRYGHVVKS